MSFYELLVDCLFKLGPCKHNSQSEFFLKMPDQRGKEFLIRPPDKAVRRSATYIDSQNVLILRDTESFSELHSEFPALKRFFELDGDALSFDLEGGDHHKIPVGVFQSEFPAPLKKGEISFLRESFV